MGQGVGGAVADEVHGCSVTSQRGETRVLGADRDGDHKPGRGRIARDLICESDCCAGYSITRFANPSFVNQIVPHNAITFFDLYRQIESIRPENRAEKFRHLAGYATHQQERFKDHIPGVRFSRQVAYWRDLL